MAVEWKNPGPPKTKPGSLFTAEILSELKAHPYKWALIKRGHRTGSGATQYNRQHTDFEVTTRHIEGLFDIYARYIGGAK